jgi:Trypsin
MQIGSMDYFMLSKAMTPQKLEAAHAIINPDYNPAAHWNINGANNIGLIRLKKPTNETEELFTKMRAAVFTANDPITFAGFGRKQLEDALSGKKLRSFDHKFLAAQAPSMAVARTVALPVSADNPIPAACTGDFGGGVFIKSGGNTELIGLIQSYDSPTGTVSRTCGGTTFFTWFSPIDSWIKSAIKELRERPLK